MTIWTWYYTSEGIMGMSPMIIHEINTWKCPIQISVCVGVCVVCVVCGCGCGCVCVGACVCVWCVCVGGGGLYEGGWGSWEIWVYLPW